MKIKVTPKRETSQVELDIVVPAKDFAPYIEKAAKKINKDHPIDGFRPGHAPKEKVIEKIGHEPILREAIDQGLPKFFVEALIEEDIPVVSRPNITIQALSLDSDLHFIATAHVVPQVKLGDVKSIKVKKRPVHVKDEELEHEIQYLAKMRSTQLEVARPAQVGDTLVVDFHVTIDGRIVEGGQSTNHPVHLGEGHFIPDFEQQLVGIKTGETRQFSVDFPADFPRQEYRGKQAVVWVKVHSVAQRIVPKIDDDFARNIGKFNDLTHLKTELKAGLAKEKKHKERDRVHGEISQKLVDISQFDPIPEVLIEREIDRQVEELTQLLAVQQKTLEIYLFEQQKTIRDIRDEMKPKALENLKVSLVLRAFSEQEKIEVSEEDIKKKAERYLAQFSSPQEIEKKLNLDELRANIASMLRSQQALHRLEALVDVSEDKP